MTPKPNNFAFIDGQNLHLGSKESGISIDFRRFRIYLREHLQVAEAYYFIGYMPDNQPLYANLQRAGFILQFKEVSRDGSGKAKGNVDVDLTIHTMDRMPDYDQAVLVTNDGDFAGLVTYLIGKNKFRTVIIPNRAKCSYLLRKAAKGSIDYLDQMRGKIDRK